MTDQLVSLDAADRLDGQVAIVTGAARGLGREYALALAARGAKVVVNGRGTDGGQAEEAVAAEILSRGGEAVASIAPVTDVDAVQAMVADTIARWGRIDILVNNAGFVRDQSFGKSSIEDFRAVLDVHLMGAAICSRLVWSGMMDAGYGRIIMAISSAGLAGGFGQAAYASAKMGMVGLMNTLGIEGARKNVHVNCFAPIGITRINDFLFNDETKAAFDPAKLTPGICFLASRQAPNRAVLMGGAGSFERAYISFTKGCLVGEGEDFAQAFDRISDREGEILPVDASDQAKIELANIGMTLS